MLVLHLRLLLNANQLLLAVKLTPGVRLFRGATLLAKAAALLPHSKTSRTQTAHGYETALHEGETRH
jgi:hypothetical protein